MRLCTAALPPRHAMLHRRWAPAPLLPDACTHACSRAEVQQTLHASLGASSCTDVASPPLRLPCGGSERRQRRRREPQRPSRLQAGPSCSAEPHDHQQATEMQRGTRNSPHATLSGGALGVATQQQLQLQPDCCACCCCSRESACASLPPRHPSPRWQLSSIIGARNAPRSSPLHRSIPQVLCAQRQGRQQPPNPPPPVACSAPSPPGRPAAQPWT